MKKAFLIGTIVLSLLVIITGCKDGSPDEEITIYDDPTTGSMTEDTGKAIFDYTEENGGITINKFKSNEALQSYLDISRAANDSDSGRNIFVIGRINGIHIIRIGPKAFSPDTDVIDILSLIDAIKLPSSIEEVSLDAFDDLKSEFTLYVPESVNTKLDLDHKLEGKIKVETVPDKQADVENEDENKEEDKVENEDKDKADDSDKEQPDDSDLTYDDRLLGRWEADMTYQEGDYERSYKAIFIFSETTLTVSQVPPTEHSNESTQYIVSKNIIYVDHDNDGKIDYPFLSYKFSSADSATFTVLENGMSISFEKK
jgi:hypothetical protein